MYTRHGKDLGESMVRMKVDATQRHRSMRRLTRTRRVGIARLALILVLLNVVSVAVAALVVRALLVDLRAAHESKAQWSGWIASATSAEEHLIRLSRELRVNGDLTMLADRRKIVEGISAKLEVELEQLESVSRTPRFATRTQMADKVAISRSQIARGLEAAAQVFAEADKGDRDRAYALSVTSIQAFEEASTQVVLMQSRFRDELDADIAESIRDNRALTKTVMIAAGVLLLVAGLIGFMMLRFIRRLNEVEVATLRHRRRERAALAEADRAARVKADFLAHMSHELRTPLTLILGYVGVLLEEGDRTKAPPARIEALRMIQTNSTHLLRVLGDVLDLAGLNAGLSRRVLESVDIHTLIAATVEGVGSEAARRGIAIECVPDGPIPGGVMTDAPLVSRVLDALVSNAVKFTERGSIRVRIGYELKTSMMRIVVTDTGIGMADAQLAKLFKEFEQGDASMARRYGGTGLGLAIAHRAAAHLDGRLSVSSRPGAGSTFVFEFPAAIVAGCEWTHAGERVPNAQPAAAAKPEPAEACSAVPAASSLQSKDGSGAKPLAQMTLVLAEDCSDIRRLVGTLLRSAGAEVVIAENGKEAVERVRELVSTGRPPALVFMDMQMPVMDGYEATRTLRASGVGLPIVALTAHALPEDRARCLAAGCSDYVTKPVTRATLIGVCTRLGRATETRAAA
jgi:signal transduction histidine kinase/ActR/RegA family two-component response regulator